MVRFITNAQDNLLSKIATNNGHGESSSAYFDGWKAYDRDPFHPSSNPSGVLQMGLAENKLCFDLINDWIIQNPQASICTTEGVRDFKDIAIFQDYHGLPEFREAVANFMGKARGGKVKFDPDRIVMGGGSTGANETLMFCLADPGDAFLIPTPYYPAFDRDMGWRTRVKLIPVHCDSSSGFAVTRAAVEDAYNRAIAKNTRVKGLVLCNPSNPLGTILDKSTLTSLVRFVNEKNIHLVADEIYAATVFKSPEFVSVAEVVEEEAEYCNRDLIHVTYSLSKDLGVPGFRVGIVYSYNDQVVNCARKMSSFGLVSTQTQRLMAHMLSDDAFVERFLEESKKRLRHRQEHFTEGVARVGIRCLRSNAGLFVWMDLRHLLKETSLDGELALWRLIIDDMRINVSPGSSFHCSEPGWFRVCFANMDDETVEVALSRIRSFMLKGTCKGGNAKEDEKIVRSKKRSWQRSDLRLSFGGGARRYDDNVVVSSPLMMSPHSPLVKART